MGPVDPSALDPTHRAKSLKERKGIRDPMENRDVRELATSLSCIPVQTIQHVQTIQPIKPQVVIDH